MMKTGVGFMLPEIDCISTLLSISNRQSGEDSTEIRIARTILENANQIGYMKNKELAQLCYVDTVTISRFVRKLGFFKYSDFREWFLMDMERKKHSGYFDMSRIQNTNEILEDHLSSLAATGKMLDMGQVDQLVNWMMETDHVLLIGNRYSQLVCQDLQYRLMSINRYVVTFPDINAQEKYLEEAKQGLVLCYSATLHHKDSHFFLKKAYKMGWKIALVTRLSSEIRDDCDLVIRFACPNSSWTVNSVEDRLCMLYINDVITYRYVKKLQNLQ